MVHDSALAKARSPELTGGAGYTYEDAVVADYLTALLREEGAAPLIGATVRRVAVQQGAVGEPLDDLVVDGENAAGPCRFSGQVKSKLVISAAASNEDFRSVVTQAVATRARPGFRVGVDCYGFIAGSVGENRLQGLNRIITRAKASATAADFAVRIAGVEFSQEDRDLYQELAPLIGDADVARGWDFYRHFVALRLDGLEPGGIRMEELRARAGQLAADPANAASLIDIILRRIRAGEGAAAVWDRASLIALLRTTVRLAISPVYAGDMAIIGEMTGNYLAEIPQDIGGVEIRRTALVEQVISVARQRRFTNISGLPGCGKSVILRQVVEAALARGPVLLLKSDRLDAGSWRALAAEHGLKHQAPTELLVEIAGAGEATLFIDGIDRIRPEYRGVVTDLMTAMMSAPALAGWRIVATSRDQGLEPVRQWIPAGFHADTGIGDVAVGLLNDEEAQQLADAKPHLHRLLFGGGGVQEIARRPFFASVLDRQFAGRGEDGGAAPQSESELIAAWWRAGGYNADPSIVMLRQRALIDLAHAGAASLGRAIRLKDLKESTLQQIAGLRQDGILDSVEEGSVVSFSHDIYFEWCFLRLLIDEGEAWPQAVIAAGEPPLLARVVSLLSQQTFETGGPWAETLSRLASDSLRPQWRRAWLLGPPGSQRFSERRSHFETSLFADDFKLLEKFLVWFQAERTIPNPLVLENGRGHLGADALVRMADTLGWPSDTQLWIRVLFWLTHREDRLPARLIPSVVELAAVFQNMCADVPNGMSKHIVDQAETWRLDLAAPRTIRERVSDPPSRWDELGRDGRDALSKELDEIILRSAQAYPDHARRLIARVAALARIPEELYTSVMVMAPLLARTCGQELADLARKHLLEELPGDEKQRLEREEEAHFEVLRAIRNKPEAKRTAQEERVLTAAFHLPATESWDFDDLGVDQHSPFYFPPTPRHQPFAALFDADPDRARALVRDIVNHATHGWRQIFEINAPRYGTPLPIRIAFPWGEQEFWGGARTYAWHLGVAAPQPVEAALLALAHWAHKRLDRGDDVDAVIRDVVEGHENSTVLGIAVSLVIQKVHISETSLALMRSQRLWTLDMYRQAQDPAQPISFFGIDPQDRMLAGQREASDYLRSRRSRDYSLRDLIATFVLSKVPGVSDGIKAALARFPDDLPFERVEDQNNEAVIADFRERARIWAGWGDPDNYRVEDHPEKTGVQVVAYVPPEPEPETRVEARQENADIIREFGIHHLADEALKDARKAAEIDFAGLIAFMGTRDRSDLFDVVEEAGTGRTQTAMASLAAAAAVFATDPEHVMWAWSVLDRVRSIKPRPGALTYIRNRFDPRRFLMAVYARPAKDGRPHPDAAAYLIEFATGEDDDLARTALVGLFYLGCDPRLPRIAGALASDLFAWPAPDDDADDDERFAPRRAHRQAAKQRALGLLASGDAPAFVAPPQAWVKDGRRPRRRRRVQVEGDDWTYPGLDFQPAWAERFLEYFPVETWMAEPETAEALLSYADELVRWTIDRVFPSWLAREARDERAHEMYAWFAALAKLIARVAGFLPAADIIDRYLQPFITQKRDAAIAFLGGFASSYVCRHVCDAAQIHDGAPDMLRVLAYRMLKDRDFNIERYRAGELHTYGTKDMVKALLLVPADCHIPGSMRFANHDFTQIGPFLEGIGDLMAKAGWNTAVMEDYLTLCERAAGNIPVQWFSSIILNALDQVADQPHLWRGAPIHARIAGLVQKLAEANHPLDGADARALLVILDRLIDLGDRRAAALQQSEHFRVVRVVRTAV